MSERLLEKPVWSEADFDRMEWHDATIYAVGFDAASFELLFDVDYICQWLLPKNSNHYSFWVAPATLVFENVHDICLDVESGTHLSIDRLTRTEQGRPRNSDAIGKEIDWRWTLQLQSGEIAFRSTGYTQYFRREPILTASQRLSLPARAGMSLEKHGWSKP
jgi:hypothetical protein